jgi:hypothetical protein
VDRIPRRRKPAVGFDARTLSRRQDRCKSKVIGEFGTAGAEREWIAAECELAIKHLKKVCGEPPPALRHQVGRKAQGMSATAYES